MQGWFVSKFSVFFFFFFLVLDLLFYLCLMGMCDMMVVEKMLSIQNLST